MKSIFHGKHSLNTIEENFPGGRLNVSYGKIMCAIYKCVIKTQAKAAFCKPIMVELFVLLYKNILVSYQCNILSFNKNHETKNMGKPLMRFEIFFHRCEETHSLNATSKHPSRKKVLKKVEDKKILRKNLLRGGIRGWRHLGGLKTMEFPENSPEVRCNLGSYVEQ